MRYLILPAFVALLASGPAMAQVWIEFVDPIRGFSINFPHEPVSEEIEYMSYYERIVPARIYRAEQGTGRYSIAVVSFSGDPTDSLTAVAHAAKAIRDKGEVLYDAFHDLDGIPGIVLSVREPGGRLIHASVYFVDQRLYISEGSVAAGNPAPAQFQQSISIIDTEGNRIVLDDF